MVRVHRIFITLLGLVGSILAWELLVMNFKAQQRIKLPHDFGNTGLILEDVTWYEGPYIEDGSCDEVTDIACLTVHNTSQQTFSQAQVQIKTVDGEYSFLYSYIPPGAKVVALEQERKQWHKQNVISCRGTVTKMAERSIPNLRVMEESDGALRLENASQEDIQNIVILHKGYLKENGLYMGGSCYETNVPCIKAGQSLLVYPGHYAVGYSKVVSVYYQ